jgi:hypothetical protein
MLSLSACHLQNQKNRNITLRPSQMPAHSRLGFRFFPAGAPLRYPLADQLNSTHHPEQKRCQPEGGEYAPPSPLDNTNFPILFGIRSGAL